MRQVSAVTNSRSDGAAALRLVVAVAGPLVVLVIAYGLWLISDALLYVGPLDRAAFGWIVVMPVGFASPVLAGFAWRTLDRRETAIAVATFTIVIATLAAALFWRSVAFPDCEWPVRSPEDWIVPSLLTGALVAGGLALSGIVSMRQWRRGRPMLAVVLGAGTQLVMTFVAIVLIGVTLLAAPGCSPNPPA
jgi:hypothetical protein